MRRNGIGRLVLGLLVVCFGVAVSLRVAWIAYSWTTALLLYLVAETIPTVASMLFYFGFASAGFASGTSFSIFMYIAFRPWMRRPKLLTAVPLLLAIEMALATIWIGKVDNVFLVLSISLGVILLSQMLVALYRMKRGYNEDVRVELNSRKYLAAILKKRLLSRRNVIFAVANLATLAWVLASGFTSTGLDSLGILGVISIGSFSCFVAAFFMKGGRNVRTLSLAISGILGFAIATAAWFAVFLFLTVAANAHGFAMLGAIAAAPMGLFSSSTLLALGILPTKREESEERGR